MRVVLKSSLEMRSNVSSRWMIAVISHQFRDMSRTWIESLLTSLVLSTLPLGD